MEQIKHDESDQTVLEFKGQNILPLVEKSSALSSPVPVQRPEIVGSQNLETRIVSQTPEKTNEPLPIKSTSEAAQLPEKFRMISEFFYRMICSLRLLSLRKKSPTFQNICSQVEILTGRKFSCKHLAQIKFILPEAVQTDRILIHDENTMCMKADMKISLLFDVLEGHREQSTYTALQLVFTSRLFNFFSTHPEGCEIPEAVLPEPFNQRSITATTDSLPLDSFIESLPNSIEAELFNSSHLQPSFTRHFSQKAVVAETEKNPAHISSIKYDCMTYQDIRNGQLKTSRESCSGPNFITNPVQQTYPPCCVSSRACGSTPMKLASEADIMMIETPTQLTPQKSVPSCDDKLKTMSSKKWMACNMSAKRSLDFSHLEAESFLNSTTDEIEQYKVVRDIIPQTGDTKGTLVEDDATISATPLPQVKENSCCTARDHMINQSGFISYQQMSPCLSDLVAVISHVFESVNCSSITKEELVHKIVMNNFDIVESREVEEQIELLETLVPDWISRKLVPSGDFLYTIKKVPDLSSVRERLISI